MPVTLRLHPATAAAIRATPQARAEARQLLEMAFHGIALGQTNGIGTSSETTPDG